MALEAVRQLTEDGDDAEQDGDESVNADADLPPVRLAVLGGPVAVALTHPDVQRLDALQGAVAHLDLNHMLGGVFRSEAPLFHSQGGLTI